MRNNLSAHISCRDCGKVSTIPIVLALTISRPVRAWPLSPRRLGDIHVIEKELLPIPSLAR